MSSILKLIGGTPIVALPSEGRGGLLAKLEFYNPSGSVKDRAAYYMIKKALERGEIEKDAVIIEPTSGNTGIGLAMVGAALGMKTILVMPENMSKERVQLLQGFGAEVVLTPQADGMAGAAKKAEALKKSIPGAYIPMQFENADNTLAHFETTAPEIFEKHSPSWIVAGVGSGGTIMGIKQYIDANALPCKVCAVEPGGSPLMTKNRAGRHQIQGIGANFIPKLMDISKMDKIIAVTDEDALGGTRELLRVHGILAGISAGAAYSAAKTLAEREEGDILFIVPDSGMRYLSANIYEG